MIRILSSLSPFVNFERFTSRRLGATPGAVKLRESSGKAGGLRWGFRDYKKALLEGFNCARDWSADLIIYQAGADSHVDDPLSTGILNTEQMLERDRMVFAHFHKNGTPLFFVLAGGYQTPIEEKLVPLHLNTFKAAFEEYCLPT